MPSQAVQPLRIQKTTPSSSPAKQRPLTELSPMERRRNSPSFNQTTKTLAFNHSDSSPFDPSPFSNSGNKASPLLFWQGRDPASPNRFGSENGPRNAGDSPSPTKRSSIENLKRASRVKNSSMFTRDHVREYDPASVPTTERPVAAGRPLSVQMQGNAFGGRGIDGLRKEGSAQRASFATGETKIPSLTPTKSPVRGKETDNSPASPSKDRSSPTKSSMSNPGRFAAAAPTTFDPENGTWSEDDEGGERQLPPGRGLHRHAKSVTFDVAPPQVNEYEATTPDISSIGTTSRESSYDSAMEGEESFTREDSADRDDSFDASLEDIEKTPVVGPEDWRRSLSNGPQVEAQNVLEDPFRSSNQGPARSDSTASNGDHRPLPPLPGLRSSSPSKDHLDGAQRALPSPPQPAAFSKSDIQSMGGAKMSLEERLRLMMIQGDADGSPTSEKRASVSTFETAAEAANEGECSILEEDYKPPPRISRESILRKVKTKTTSETDITFSSPVPGSSPERSILRDLDPDMPIPSTETVSVTTQEVETSVVIKQEDDGEGSDFDPYTIPDIYNAPSRDISDPKPRDRFDFNAGTQNPLDDDVESSYSCDSSGEQVPSLKAPSINDDGLETPRQRSPVRGDPIKEMREDSRVSLPEFASMLGDDDFGLHDKFGLGLQSYMTPSPPAEAHGAARTKEPEVEVEAPAAEEATPEPITPTEQVTQPDFPTYDGEGYGRSESPDSVIRHSLTSEGSLPEPVQEPDPLREPEPEPEPVKIELPTVPDPVATIKAPGGKLKTRPSITPTDAAAMAAMRRQVSGESAHHIPTVPAIPERHRARPSGVLEDAHEDSVMSDLQASVLTLDVPMEEAEGELGLGLDKEFDRLLEAKKRGYLMRQNTKVIVASSNNTPALGSCDLKPTSGRGTRSAGNSPRKGSHDRPSWSVEPWNGKMRQKSTKETGSVRKKPVGSGAAVPPLPGQASNVTSGLGSLTEGEAAIEERQEGVERGRLFVKVVGVKDLGLPLPKGQKSLFNLTLDNGIHCVQTAWLELGRNAPVGQEFELVVLDDLEFTLTLQTEEPKEPPPAPVEAPAKGAKTPKPSAFSRVFASPRKRKEMEKKQQEEEQRAARQKQEAAQARKVSSSKTAWELLHNLVARDGSFARSYFSLQEYESQAFGRPCTINIPCFNEWATDDSGSTSSTRSKHGGVQRRAPYQIGFLELQVLFVPKLKGAKEADMPKSLNACIRELQEAEANVARKWEGFLSQQGGDCPYWRRRLFKLSGSKLTAYHESTRQPRATINLAKASKLIDDRTSLMQKEASSKGRSRRKSAFAEEEEGYMFVEEGFRVRFANGEVIDFYADSAEEKDGWMKVLSEVVGKDTSSGTGGMKSWTDVVLARERSRKEAKANTVQSQSGSGSQSGSRNGSATRMQRPKSMILGGAGTGAVAVELGEGKGKDMGKEGAKHQKRGSTSNVPRSMVF